MSLSKFICNIVDIMKSVYYSKPEIDAKVDSLNNAKANTNHSHKNLATTTLGANTDFNEITTEGIYRISWDNAQSASNIPTKQGGGLAVIPIFNGIKQIYFIYQSSSAYQQIYHRNYYPPSQTWFGWRKINDSSI